jgi:hypothetical protein
MVDVGDDVHDAARPDGPIFGRDPDPSSPRGDEVDLVLRVRRLVVDAAGRPQRDRGAERLGAEELREVVARPVETGDEIVQLDASITAEASARG